MNPPTPFRIREATAPDIPALRLDTQLIEDRTYFVAEVVEQGGLIVGCGGWSNRKTLFGSDHGPNRENAFLDQVCRSL
jgi:hypothetical protein